MTNDTLNAVSIDHVQSDVLDMMTMMYALNKKIAACEGLTLEGSKELAVNMRKLSQLMASSATLLELRGATADMGRDLTDREAALDQREAELGNVLQDLVDEQPPVPTIDVPAAFAAYGPALTEGPLNHIWYLQQRESSTISQVFSILTHPGNVLNHSQKAYNMLCLYLRELQGPLAKTYITQWREREGRTRVHKLSRQVSDNYRQYLYNQVLDLNTPHDWKFIPDNEREALVIAALLIANGMNPFGEEEKS